MKTGGINDYFCIQNKGMCADCIHKTKYAKRKKYLYKRKTVDKPLRG